MKKYISFVIPVALLLVALLNSAPAASRGPQATVLVAGSAEPGSVDNLLAVRIRNASQYYPLPTCSVFVTGYPSFLTRLAPSTACTSPRDIGARQSGAVSILFDVSPDAQPGGSGNINIIVASSIGGQDTLAIPITVTEFLCGDVNGSGPPVNIADLTYFVAYLFRGGPPPIVMASANVNGDGLINVADLTYFVSYLFRGGPAPACP